MPHVEKQIILNACNKGIQQIDTKRAKMKARAIETHTKRFFGLLPNRTPEEAWAAVDPHDVLGIEIFAGKQRQQLVNIWQAYYHDADSPNAIVKIGADNFATIAPFLPTGRHSQQTNETFHESPTP